MDSSGIAHCVLDPSALRLLGLLASTLRLVHVLAQGLDNLLRVIPERLLIEVAGDRTGERDPLLDDLSLVVADEIRQQPRPQDARPPRCP